MFDIAALDSRTLSQKGVKFVLKNPSTNRPYKTRVVSPGVV